MPSNSAIISKWLDRWSGLIYLMWLLGLGFGEDWTRENIHAKLFSRKDGERKGLFSSILSKGRVKVNEKYRKKID